MAAATWRIVSIGRLGRGPESDLVARYLGRLNPAVSLLELPDGRGAIGEAKRREGEALLAAVPAGAFAVALDLGGRSMDSETFSASLVAWRSAGRMVAFLVGGAEGLDQAVIARADIVLSLGSMTWPHPLVRVMLAEQLFRAQAIATGHPYHRAGRPGP